MKIKMEMELADVLRISVLLDHHRAEATGRAEIGREPTAEGRLFSIWGGEAAELNKKLLEALGTTR